MLPVRWVTLRKNGGTVRAFRRQETGMNAAGHKGESRMRANAEADLRFAARASR